MADYDTSTTTVRQAINVLRNEGHVVGQQGKGTYVRRARDRHVRVVGELYSRRAASSPVAAAVGAAGGRARWDHSSSRIIATRAVAKRLGIIDGAPIMCTNYRFFADEEPILISTSFEPLELTAGTPIELPESGPAVGVVARFDSIGLRIDRVVEQVTARAPRPYEEEALRIPAGVPVMSVERSYLSSERVVETADIVVAGDNYALRYGLDIA